MSLVTYELDDHIATITLNRPEARNAINGPLRNELNAAWERFRGEEDAWVGILTANGDVFCAGGDLKDGEGSVGTFARHVLGEADDQFLRERDGAVQADNRRGTRSLHRLWVDRSAVLRLRDCHDRGHLLLPRGVDRRPHHRRGHPAPPTGRLGQCHGAAADREADECRAGQGDRFGVEAGRARRAANGGPRRGPRPSPEAAPLAQRATKEVAWRTADMGWIESVRFGEVMRKVAGATEDAAEGVRAWREKRKPDWRGR